MGSQSDFLVIRGLRMLSFFCFLFDVQREMRYSLTMKTFIVYLRSGVKYSHTFNGQLTVAQAQRALLDAKIGCSRIVKLEYLY